MKHLPVTAVNVPGRPTPAGYQPPSGATSSSAWRQNLQSAVDWYHSPTGSNVVMAAQLTSAAGIAGGSALAAGAGAVAAAAAVGTVGAAVAVGMAAGWLAQKAVEAIGPEVFLDLFGLEAMPAPPSSMTAFVGMDVYHSGSFLGAFLMVAAVVVAAVAAAALTVATGGLAGVLIGAAAAGAIGGTGAAIAGILGGGGSKKGAVLPVGSTDVFINGKAAARKGDLIGCSQHNGPQMISQGCKTVYVNGMALSRVSHKTTCGGTLNNGSENVHATTEDGASLAIASEVPLWLQGTLIALDWLPLPRRIKLGGSKTGTPPKVETQAKIVIRQDDYAYSATDAKGRPKSHLDQEGNLVPAGNDKSVTIDQHVRGSQPKKSVSPFTSTTDPEISAAPKDYGSTKIEIDVGRVQTDVKSGKLKDVVVHDHQTVKQALQSKVDVVQAKYDANPTPKNEKRLQNAKRDLEHAVRDGEVLIEGTVPSEYIVVK